MKTYFCVLLFVLYNLLGKYLCRKGGFKFESVVIVKLNNKIMKQKKQTLCGIFKKMLFVFMGFTLPLNLLAQNEIKGKIVDNKGEDVAFANVLIKGTALGVMSNEKGEFTISIPQNVTNPTLEIKFIGFSDKEEVVGGRSFINVTLQPETNQLEEVVVIGYGTTKVKDITTAVSTVSTKDLDQRPIVKADQAIQGKAAGVTVVSPNGSPGSKMSIRIRGANSMISSNDPLYVVDGIPMTDISFLSANDIESMSILKDASSAAIYGSRSSGGVVMITTKSGKKGDAKITFNAYMGVTDVNNEIESLNTEEYRKYLEDLGSSIVLPKDLTDQTDWFKETYQTGIVQNYQVSVSDAGEKFKYYISGGYNKEKGILKVAFFERYNFRSNLENKIRPWLTVGTNIAYSDYSNNGVITGTGANRGGVVLSVIAAPKYAPVWDNDNKGQYFNNFYGISNISTPSENLARSANNKEKVGRLIASGFAEIKFTPYLKFRSTVSMNRNNTLKTTFNDPVSTSEGRKSLGDGSDERTQNTEMIFDNILTFDKSFGKHNLNLMAGTSGTTSDWRFAKQSGNHFIDGIETLNGANKIDPYGTNTQAAQWTIMSYLSRVSYNYNDKYLLTVNMRADGSSKLHPDYRWGYFPSLSAGWRFTNEEFMKGVEWLEDAKIRVGWGQTGNQSGLQDYQHFGRYNLQRVDWWKPGNENKIPILAGQSVLPNSELTWETSTQTNFGIDFSLFKSRLNITVDYYYKKTTDMLMEVKLPAGSAASNTVVRNEGEMTNKGFEFSVSSRNLIGELRWTTDFNISFNRNKLNKLQLVRFLEYAKTNDNVNETVVRNIEGRSLGGFYGYISDGVNPETGELIYRDLNDNGIIGPQDRTYIGDPNPDFTFGMTNTFSYKGFMLNVLIQGSYGNDVYNVSRMEMEGMYNAQNQAKSVLNRWRVPGQITKTPKAGFTQKNSSYYVEDGSYLKVRDITLAYDFSFSFLKKIGINKLQPYVTGSNLLTLTKYSGMDPEVNQYENSGVVQGIDWGTYPHTKSFIFGVNIEF